MPISTPSYCLTGFFFSVVLFLALKHLVPWPQVIHFAEPRMKRILHKAKSIANNGTSQEAAPIDPSPQHIPTHDGTMDEERFTVDPVTLQDVMRYRYHHGVNLGSIFILERWLTPSMFSEEPKLGSSELAAAEYNIQRFGLEAAREKQERHWREYVTDADLDWLRDVGKCTTVRLPIGFFTLGPEWCKGTAFEKVAPLYQNAWKNVRRLVARLHERKIGTLIDVHGLPGGANKNEHSGTNSNKAEFWSSKKNLELGTRVMCFIAEEAKSMAGVAGLQIVNEAEWSHNSKSGWKWYDDVLRALGAVDPTIPIYVSDAWFFLKAAVQWGRTRNMAKTGCNPVVLDTHLYWCFDPRHESQTPYQIIDDVRTKLSELDGNEGSVHKEGAAEVIVGEYSCVLGERTWAKSGGKSKEELVRLFGHAQSAQYQQRAGGTFFWTYKMDWMPGGEWGFKQMTEQGAICCPAHLAMPASEVAARLSEARQHQSVARKSEDVAKHISFWDARGSGSYEHWRYEMGWTMGWNDAIAFFEARSRHFGLEGCDKIGMLDLWILKRLRDCRQTGEFVWQWEQGFRKGVQSFYEAVGISGHDGS